MQKLALLSLFLLSTTVGFAQCSMCKAVAETADGGGFGAGLNYGIVYLMIFPLPHYWGNCVQDLQE